MLTMWYLVAGLVSIQEITADLRGHASEKVQELGRVYVPDAVADDNWGAPSHKVDHYKGTPMTELTKDCDWGWDDYPKKFKGATLQWYPSTKGWQTYGGYNLVPEGAKTLRPPLNKLDTKTQADYASTIKGGRCFVPEDEDGYAWTFERIGPFKSVGNYDWWQFSWDDTFKMEERVLSKYPEGYFIVNHFSGGVDAEGNTLPFPPIHVHHVHNVPGAFINTYRSNIPKCVLKDKHFCPMPYRVVFEQHGDYQCTEPDGGVKCLLEDLPEGYAKYVTRATTINGELNDVRAKGSPELEWYYQAAIRYIPKAVAEKKLKTPYKALGLHYFWSPGRLDLADQSTMVNTFRAPTDKDTMIWYTGKMFYKGKLIRGKMHTHNTVFDTSFFFSATPEQLGMGGKKFIPPTDVFEPIPLSYLGYDSIDAAKQYIFKSFYQSVEKAEKSGITLPRLICYGATSNVPVDFPTGTYKFDRRAPTHCDEWSFKPGEIFVVVGFNKHAGGPPGPHMPDRIPEWLPGHLHWFLNTDTEQTPYPGVSAYEYGFYSQDPTHSFESSQDPNKPFGSLLNMISMVLKGGMPSAIEWRFIAVGLVGLGLLALSVVLGILYGTYTVIKVSLGKQD